ncbi:hypothetical protein CFOL_v3_03473, partial [Cephalotus follicularis]
REVQFVHNSANFLILLSQKKLSIPSTVSHVLKYIPELQKKVEGLIQKKEVLLSRICKPGDFVDEKMQSKSNIGSSLSTFSASRLNESEVVIQLCTLKALNPLFNIMLILEKDGLRLINLSSFESYGGRVFYILHLKVIE